jgi:pyridoxamine 5'-phosphate oxidase-like protein
VFCWSDLENAAPEVAARGRERIERFRFVYVGTIRKDGTPRISPVEAHIVRGHLMLVMIAGTLKARDLRRDARLVLNSPVFDPADPGAELKLRGRAVEVDDGGLRRATADAIEAASGWRPPDDWHFFAVDIEDASHIAWEGGVMDMTRWSRDAGVRRDRRPVAVLGPPQQER